MLHNINHYEGWHRLGTILCEPASLLVSLLSGNLCGVYKHVTVISLWRMTPSRDHPLWARVTSCLIAVRKPVWSVQTLTVISLWRMTPSRDHPLWSRVTSCLIAVRKPVQTYITVISLWRMTPSRDHPLWARVTSCLIAVRKPVWSVQTCNCHIIMKDGTV